MRIRECIDSDWSFALADDAGEDVAAIADSRWRRLNLPHDWSVEATPHPDNPAEAGGGFFPGAFGAAFPCPFVLRVLDGEMGILTLESGH